MSVTVGTDSYITIAEATTILENYFDTDNWTGATTANQELALTKATKNIDSLKLRFSKYDEDQTLQFPRNCLLRGRNDLVLGTVPDLIKEAQAVEALGVLDQRAGTTNSLVELQKLGVKSQSVEGTSVTFSDDEVTAQRNRVLISDEAKSLLKPYIATVVARR